MAKPRNVAMDYLVYLAVRFLVCIVQALPYATACRVAAALAWLAYRVDRRHRLVAEDNLRLAFPGQHTDAERTVLVKAVYRHFCTLAMEIIFLPRKLFLTNWRRHQDLRHGRRLVEALLSGRPLMLVTAHFGNWELSGFALGLLGFKTSAIARQLDNPFVDRFLARFRKKTGQQILDKERDWPKIQAVLQQGGILATLGDQDAGQKGQFVDFFGRPASTHKAVAILALEFNAIMLVSMTAKLGEPLCYENIIDDVIFPEEYKDRPDAVSAITRRFTEAIERVVREFPEQYFWLHRRWKHQPKERKAKKAA